MPVPILAGTGCLRTADQGAGLHLTPWQSRHIAGGADGAGDTIRTHGTNVIEAAAGVVTASTWPMVPTWF